MRCGPNPWLRRTAQMRCSSAAANAEQSSVPETGCALLLVAAPPLGAVARETRKRRATSACDQPASTSRTISSRRAWRGAPLCYWCVRFTHTAAGGAPHLYVGTTALALAARTPPRLDDRRVVREGEVRQLVGREEADLQRLRAGAGRPAADAAGPGDEDHRIAGRAVDAEQALDLDLDRGFLEHLAPRRILDGLAAVDEAGGEAPAAVHRIMVAAHEQDRALVLDHDAGGELGVLPAHEVAVRAGRRAAVPGLRPGAGLEGRPAVRAVAGPLDRFVAVAVVLGHHRAVTGTSPRGGSARGSVRPPRASARAPSRRSPRARRTG